MPGKCTFNNTWLSKPEYSSWLARDSDPHKASCSGCRKSFDIGNMGEAALKSHTRSVKHKNSISAITDSSGVPTRPVSSFFSPSSNTSNSNEQGPSQSAPTPGPANISTYLTTDAVLKAEVLWTLKVIESHYSFNSTGNISNLFGLMFPDSEIAGRFQCGGNKTSYLSTYGLGPYFTSLLKVKIKKADKYVLLFDESLNKYLKRKQLDIHARFWDEGSVTTRYLTSEFLGHSTADDLHERLLPIIQEFGTTNLCQLSMDGPNVNWKVHDMLSKDVKRVKADQNLLNAGSCGMHTIHNAFRSGCKATGWDIEEILCSMHRLFKDCPAREDDYKSVTKSSELPTNFCRHRWLENVSVMRQALLVKPNVKQYVEAAQKGKITKPTSKTYDTVCSAIKDPLFDAKGEFFISVAGELEPFLSSYQTDEPMLPYMASDLYQVLKNLMQRFMKDDILAGATNALKMSKIDVVDAKNHKDQSHVDVGFVTKNLLLKLTLRKTISDRALLQFKLECKRFLINVCKKVLEKSPIKYPLVRTAIWLDPTLVASQPTKCKTTLSMCLQLLADAGHVIPNQCDTILREFQQLVDNSKTEESLPQFASFNSDTDRLDKFYYDLEGVPQYTRLWSVIKLMLTLSHGQATVERGFSVNKELSVENQKA